MPFLERAGLLAHPVSDDTRAHVGRIVEAMGDRLRVFGDILLQATFFFGDDVTYDDKAFAKRVRAPGAAERLADYRGWLAAQTAFDAAALEAGTKQFVETRGIGMGDIVHAVRVATTGTAIGRACSTACRSWARTSASAASTAHWHWPPHNNRRFAPLRRSVRLGGGGGRGTPRPPQQAWNPVGRKRSERPPLTIRHILRVACPPGPLAPTRAVRRGGATSAGVRRGATSA